MILMKSVPPAIKRRGGTSFLFIRQPHHGRHYQWSEELWENPIQSMMARFLYFSLCDCEKGKRYLKE